jgi:hypothetical protein
MALQSQTYLSGLEPPSRVSVSSPATRSSWRKRDANTTMDGGHLDQTLPRAG